MVLVTQQLLLDLGFIKIVTLVLPYSHSLRGKPTSQGFHKTKAELISLLFDWNKNVYFRGCKMKKNKQSFEKSIKSEVPTHTQHQLSVTIKRN